MTAFWVELSTLKLLQTCMRFGEMREVASCGSADWAGNHEKHRGDSRSSSGVGAMPLPQPGSSYNQKVPTLKQEWTFL